MEQKTRVLLVEDDVNLGSILKQYLNIKGYETDLAEDGEKGYRVFTQGAYDVCVLDVMMPKKDGFSLAKDIRLINSRVPIIFLTAKNMQDDVIQGFKAGGDDYLTKPFNMEELLVRIEAILRRTNSKEQNPHKTSFVLGKFTFHPTKQLLVEGEMVSKLTTKESELLNLLCNNMNSVLERNLALKTIWLEDNYFNARSMDVYITKLRKHLKSEERVEIINVHGKGYKLIVSEGSATKP